MGVVADMRRQRLDEVRTLDPMVPPNGIVTDEQRLGRTVALRRLRTLYPMLALRGD